MIRIASLAAAALLAAGCSTTPPAGPAVLVLPGTGKNFDQFRFDDQECRGYAATHAPANSDTYYSGGGSLQQRYDHAFVQCMYAKGHRVPVAGRYSDSGRPAQSAANLPPPPPPGKPPAEAPPDYKPTK